MKWRLKIVMVAMLASVLSMQAVVVPSAAAIDARTFNPGRIIDDGIFTNSDAMTVEQIQNFLNSKMPNCDTYGTRIVPGTSLTDRQWIEANYGISPPYRCLNDYRENPDTAENNYGKTTSPAGSLSTAELIHRYSKQFNINPQVIIVTLQKENGLITDYIPIPKNYSEAMGFGCPDNRPAGAPACDPAYGSFSMQLYQAARHFRGYIDNGPGWYVPYTTGWNTILWNPAKACGTSSVFIENRSTAALYSYTPYRPNQAALNAQYGYGDNCSAYGNRNFYLFFNDWFGSTYINSNLLRSVNDATVYLVSGTTKYPIPSLDILGALSPLGGVGVVGQAYLDGFSTGTLASRLIRAPDGTLFFYDSGVKYPFTTCEMVAAYGLSCGSYMQLTQPQVDVFVTGHVMTNGVKTDSGRSFYISQGSKREVYDEQSLAAAGVSVNYSKMPDSAVSQLHYGAPVVRDGVFVRSRQDWLLLYGSQNNQLVAFQPNGLNNNTLANLAYQVLDKESIALIKQDAAPVDGYIKSSEGASYFLTWSGKKQIDDATSVPGAPTVLAKELVDQLPGSGSMTTTPFLVKSTSNATVYALVNGELRPFVAMEDLFAVTGEAAPYIASMSDDYINSLTRGNIIVGTGRLVMTPTNATVYTTDGYDRLIPMSSFIPASELGINMHIRVISDAILAKYNVDHPARLSAYVVCNGSNYLGMAGSLYPVNLSNQEALSLDKTTCRTLALKTETPRFLRTSDGTIFELKGSTVHPITSMQTYSSLYQQGGGLMLSVSSHVISQFELGTSL